MSILEKLSDEIGSKTIFLPNVREACIAGILKSFGLEDLVFYKSDCMYEYDLLENLGFAHVSLNASVWRCGLNKTTADEWWQLEFSAEELYDFLSELSIGPLYDPPKFKGAILIFDNLEKPYVNLDDFKRDYLIFRLSGVCNV